MGAQRTYHIAGNLLTIDVGSVLDVPAEVVVSSDDYLLTMGGGVSAAIRMAAGSALVLDAAKAVPSCYAYQSMIDGPQNTVTFDRFCTHGNRVPPC